MNDKSKTKSQLIVEINELRERVVELENMVAPASPQVQDLSQSIIDNSPAFFVIIDSAGKTKMMNKSMLTTLGYSEKEVQGKNYLSTFVPERDREQLSAIIEEQLLQGESTLNRNHILTKDGQEILVEWQGRPIMDAHGEVEFFCGIGLDITKRQKTEEAYRLLVESSLQALVILQDGHIVFANPAAEVLAGYRIEELLSMENPIQTLIHPDDLPSILDRITRRTRGETVPPLAIYRILHKNGQIRWVESYTKQIEFNGKPADHTVYIDITNRKQAEDELKRISQDEIKRREELEKLREISANMRQAEGSSELLQVFTKEVQKLCQADVASSMLFKSKQELITFLTPEANLKLSQEQLKVISDTLSKAEESVLPAKIPGFKSVFVLQLQSPDSVHGAVMVASQKKGIFTADQQNLLNATADMAGTALNRIDILETLEERVQQRTHDLVVLYNLITIISENWRLQDILELSLVLTLETVKADHGIIYLTDGQENPDLKPVIQRGFGDGFQIETGSLPDEELVREVLKQLKPLSFDSLSDNPAYAKFKGLNSYAGIPILVRGEARGVFSLFASKEDVFGSEEMALLASIADHLGIGIDNSVLWEQSRESAALEERNRLARNLHDSVSQLLYSLTLMAGSTKKMLERDHDLNAVKHSVARLGDTAHQALKEMRLLLYELRPAVLDSEGLVNALRHRIETVEERLGMKVDLQAEGLPELPSNMEDALYHIALEALNNIVKHSESTDARIKLTSKGGNIVMEILDNGKGFDTDQPQKGLGLRNMHERGQMLGGEVEVTSTPGKGTHVRVKVKASSVSLVES